MRPNDERAPTDRHTVAGHQPGRRCSQRFLDPFAMATQSDFQILLSASYPDLETVDHRTRSQARGDSPWSQSADVSQDSWQQTPGLPSRKTTKRDHLSRIVNVPTQKEVSIAYRYPITRARPVPRTSRPGYGKKEAGFIQEHRI